MYDEVLMPPELRKAHQLNDKAVMLSYNFIKKDDAGKRHWLSEQECITKLMTMYKKLTEESR